METAAPSVPPFSHVQENCYDGVLEPRRVTVREPMRTVWLAVLAAALPTMVSAGERADRRQSKPATAAAPRPVKPNPCAAYGPGFVAIEGTSTCIKMGGFVRYEFGRGPR